MIIERVEWLDSLDYDATWLGEEAMVEFDDKPMLSVGFVVKEDERWLTVATSMNPNAETKRWGNVFSIPKVSILSRRKMRLDGH